MRTGKEFSMSTLFTAWGYEVSYLEFSAVIASFVAVVLGALGKRIAWPWWVLSSSLYGIFFYQVELLASALLQIVFILAAIWGWFGWSAAGARPRFMKNSERVLDLGCGDGTTAIPAAKLSANVLGVDISRNLVAAGNRRAQEAGLDNCAFIHGDASNLSGIDNNSFDRVVSIFGAMFAPKHFDVAREMVAVS